MKRLFILILAALILAGSAAADSIDLSSMSYDELVALREQLNLAIWNCQEWQEVTVPEGTYIIGKDIPAGHWSIRTLADKHEYFNIFYFDVPDEFGRKPGLGAKLLSQSIGSPGFSGFGEVNSETVDIDMKDGWYL